MSKVQSKPLTCWTKWLKENTSLVKNSFHTLCHSQLKQRDQKYRYTSAHGILASCPCDEVLVKVLSVLKNKSLISLLMAKDKDGDIPLQSAVKSNVDAKIIKLVLMEVPRLKRAMLLAANKKGDVPLKTAFDMRRWPIVEILLEQSIKCGVVPHLTGIGDPNVTKGSSTLLHQAMKRGDIEYLRILLNVCKKCDMPLLPALLVPNKKRCTPWYYLLNQNIQAVEEALQVLSEFQIDINKLYCDENGKQYIPHVAYRSHNEELKDLWKSFGGRIDLQDSSNQTPPERTRKISFDSLPPSPVPLLHHVKTALFGAFFRVQPNNNKGTTTNQSKRRRRKKRSRKRKQTKSEYEAASEGAHESQTIARVENQNMREEEEQNSVVEEAQEVVQEVGIGEDIAMVGEEAQETEREDDEEVDAVDANETAEAEDQQIEPEEAQDLEFDVGVEKIENGGTDRVRSQSRGGGVIGPQSRSDRNHTLLRKEVEPVAEETPIQPLPFPHGGNINAEQLHNNTCELLSQSSMVDAVDAHIPLTNNGTLFLAHENNTLISSIGVFGNQR